jgi:NAD(P)-dependent dehydrogenase (short-subunit alcohol dehydrogenase family)
VFVCAGGLVGGPVLQSDVDVWRRAAEERLWGALHVVRHAAPRMTQGSITLTSGSLGSRPMPGTAMTASLAGAIEGLTRALELELAPLRVNAIAPGPVDTRVLNDGAAGQFMEIASEERAWTTSGF